MNKLIETNVRKRSKVNAKSIKELFREESSRIRENCKSGSDVDITNFLQMMKVDRVV